MIEKPETAPVSPSTLRAYQDDLRRRRQIILDTKVDDTAGLSAAIDWLGEAADALDTLTRELIEARRQQK